MNYAELFFRLTKKRVLYNIMPIKNIPTVIKHGILSYNNIDFQHESIADPDVQERRNKTIPNGKELHSYVNLYFDPRNPMMYRRRDQHNFLCVLAVNAQILNLNGIVISDQNAARNYAKFIAPNEMETALDYIRDWNDDDAFEKSKRKAIKCAEVLVPNCIPYQHIVGAIVSCNESKELLLKSGFCKRIKIDPDIFFR